MSIVPEPGPRLPGGTIHGARHYYAVRVYYEDTDLSGITYHANYLRWFERARSDLLRMLEIDQRGKVRLSMRVVDQETGEELEDTRPPREPREGGGGRGGDRRGPRGGGGGRGGDRGGRGGGRGGDRGGDRGGNRDGGSSDGPAHVPDFLKD